MACSGFVAIPGVGLHRLSTIRDPDFILVMEGGQIVKQGNHSSLSAAGGAYAALYALQFAARWRRFSEAAPADRVCMWNETLSWMGSSRFGLVTCLTQRVSVVSKPERLYRLR